MRHTGIVIIATLHYVIIVPMIVCALAIRHSTNPAGCVDGTGHTGHVSIAQTRPVFDARVSDQDAIAEDVLEYANERQFLQLVRARSIA